MSFNKSTAYTHAISIVSSALTAGTIKFEGPSVGSDAGRRVLADAAYINGLINSIAENLIVKTKNKDPES